YFHASDGSHGAELWKSNGTEASTMMVEDIRPGPASGALYEIANLDGTAFFSRDDGTNGSVTSLWKSSGLPENTLQVKPFPTGTDSASPAGLVQFNGGALFAASDR